MTLNSVIAVILPYSTEFNSFGDRLRQSIISALLSSTFGQNCSAVSQRFSFIAERYYFRIGVVISEWAESLSHYNTSSTEHHSITRPRAVSVTSTTSTSWTSRPTGLMSLLQRSALLAMQTAVIGFCLSVCLSHSDVSSRRMKIRSCGF